MSGLTNTTMTALKVAMAVAMTFQRETVQQCGGVPLDQLAQLTAQLQPDWLPLQTRPVCRTPPTPPPHPLAHIPTHACLVLSAACSLCKQAKAAKGALCPGPGVCSGRKVDTGRQQARVPRWDEEDGGGCWTCLQHKSATAARLSNLAAPLKTSCANLLEDTGGGYLPQQLECQQLIRRLTSFASQPIICFLSRRVWILSVTGVPIETTITPPTNTYCHNLPVFTPPAELVMAK